MSNLTLLDNTYPKAIYFRNVENSAANPSISYEKWAKRWSKLDGIIAKALDEEIPGISGLVQKRLIQYKKDNPKKMLLLHFNGTARQPFFDREHFRNQDWTYFVGTYSTNTINQLDSKIPLKDTSYFRDGDDVVIVPVTDRGELNWELAEQTKLIKISPNKSITLDRGYFGSETNSYKPHRAYLAAHVSQPPYSTKSKQQLWRYNFTNIASNNNMPTRLSNNLSKYLANNGVLSSFDGIVFDVLVNTRSLKHKSRNTPIDYNFDGKNSDLDRIHLQNYSSGVHLFISHLRKQLGHEKLLLADGNEMNQQREVKLLNGIESETWPSHWDPEIEQWSSGLNRHLFWKSRSSLPSFNYIKLGKLPSKNGPSTVPPINFSRLRIAGALLTDSAIAPTIRSNEKGVDSWPELTGLKRNYSSWLGKATSEVTIYRENEISLKHDIKNQGEKSSDIFKKLNKRPIEFNISFYLPESSDVNLELESLSLTSTKNGVSYISIVPNNDISQKNMTWNDSTPFKSSFLFKNLRKGNNLLTFKSDAQEVKILKMNLSKGKFLFYRTFENGVVIANPTRTDFVLKAINIPNKHMPVQSSTIPKKDMVILSNKKTM